MTRAPPENITVTEADIGPGTGGHKYPPQSAPTQSPQGVSSLADGSGPIFSMYLEMASEQDEKMAENWKADAEGILVFTGLFSAAVASFISVSIQDIRPNPQDTSNFYLANIYQTVADPNRSNISSSLPSSPPPFSPPNYAVWVNSLWFLSLVISITCALLATLLQQWARRYLKVAQSRYNRHTVSLHKRARIRTFFFAGVDKCLLPLAVEALPTLLHVSLFLFFAGLVVFLRNVDLTIFKLVLSWVCVCTALYGCVTFMPVFRRDSPYHTPLSPVARAISVTFLMWSGFLALSFLFIYHCFRHFFRCEGIQFFRTMNIVGPLANMVNDFVLGMLKTAEEAALNSPSEIDARALMLTFESLDEDHELERFFSGFPGFRGSTVVKDPVRSLTDEEKEKLSTALIRLLDRTFSSDLLPESDKNRRAIICANALDPAEFSYAYWYILRRAMSKDQHRGLQTAEFIRAMRGWGGGGDRESALIGQAIFTSLVAKAQRHNDSWLLTARNELGIPEADLRDYAAHGDNLSLASLVLITRHQISHYGKLSWPTLGFSTVLGEASEFNVQNTSPELQHEFCALWNRLVLDARKDNREGWLLKEQSGAWDTLGHIRKVYLALHQDTNSIPGFAYNWNYTLHWPSLHPVCDVPGHIHDDSASTTIARTVLLDNAALGSASLASSDSLSSSAPAPLHVDESLTTVSPLHNPHPAHQRTTESLRIPVTSPDPTTTGAIREIVTSGITTSHPTPSTSTPGPPLSSPSPPAAVVLRQNADPLTPSGTPNIPSSASSNPVLDDIPPTGPPLSSHSPITRSDLSPSRPEFHRSIMVTTAPSASPGPASAPDRGAAVDDDGSPKPGLRKEKDNLDPPSVNRVIHADTMAALDPPPQSPSLLLYTDSDVAIVGPSLRGPNAERTGDHPPYPSHCSYDIV